MEQFTPVSTASSESVIGQLATNEASRNIQQVGIREYSCSVVLISQCAIAETLHMVYARSL